MAARPVLDWRGSEHWSRRSGRCVHCGNFTRLLADDGRLSHKVCAELAAARDDEQQHQQEERWTA